MENLESGPIERKAKAYATEKHNAINHRYDGKPYTYHLGLVRSFAAKYIHHIPEEKRDIVLAGCWVHDSIEDALQTYNDVKKACGEDVANLAYALTNEKGRNRKERASLKYYDDMRNTEFATFIKICDRLANVYHSSTKNKKSKMLKLYAKEHDKFKLLVSEIYVTTIGGQFLKWLFLRSITRLNFPGEYFTWVRYKYVDMWDDLDRLYL